MRVLLKLSGESLGGPGGKGIDSECLMGFAKEIAEAVKAGANAGKLVRALCQLTGGNGGGRPDSAMGGAGDPEKIAEALTRLPELI